MGGLLCALESLEGMRYPVCSLGTAALFVVFSAVALDGKTGKGWHVQTKVLPKQAREVARDWSSWQDCAYPRLPGTVQKRLSTVTSDLCSESILLVLC